MTDYVRHALFLGRTYGVDADAMPFMQGFASNPMDKPEASKISLFSVANMTWNAKAYDSDKTWKDSIRILFPGCASAMQTFADHNSDGGPGRAQLPQGGVRRDCPRGGAGAGIGAAAAPRCLKARRFEQA